MLRTFDEIFSLIVDVQLRDAVLAFHAKTTDEQKFMPASIGRHHGYQGGYARHVREVCSNCIDIVTSIDIPLADGNYTIDDLVVAAYFHDVDKLFCRYKLDPELPTSAQVTYAKSLGIAISDSESKSSLSSKIDSTKNGRGIRERDVKYFVYRTDIESYIPAAKVCQICAEHGINLSDAALHAISFHEGGWSQGINSRTNLQPLAAILHAADLLSSVCQNGY